LEKQWFLESLGTNGAHLDFVITLPCRIGRSKENDLVIANLGLSRVHATLTRDISGLIRLVDENSTNGTYVNRRRIEGYCLLKENDIVHLANAEFKLRLRLVEQDNVLSFDEMHTTIMPEGTELSADFVANEVEFDELIRGYGLSGAAQPIVDVHTRQIVGYELLGRANHPQLPQMPIELFGLAEAMDRELDLSRAFRGIFVDRAAIGRGDKEALLALVAEDIEWIIPGEDWPLAGTRHGHAGLADLLETASKSVETSTEPREFVAQGDRVLVVGFARGKIKATNKTFEDDWIFAITVRDGKLTNIREYVDTQALARASQMDASGPA